jgi:hypothetical protein
VDHDNRSGIVDSCTEVVCIFYHVEASGQMILGSLLSASVDNCHVGCDAL